METRRGSQLTVQVLFVLVGACSGILTCRASAQPFELKPPAEWILPSSPVEAKLLTGKENWELINGQTLVGELVEWFDASGVLVFRNHMQQVVYYPARMLVKDRQEYAARLLEAKRTEVAPYEHLEPLLGSRGLIPDSSCITTSAAALTIVRDQIIFRVTYGYARAPVSAFEAEKVELLRQEEAAREVTPDRWMNAIGITGLIAKLVGQQGDSFVFRDERREIYPAIPDFEFLYAKSNLSESARVVAEKELQRLASLSPPETPHEPLTTFHIWFGTNVYRLGPAEPISIQNNKTLVARGPRGEELTIELATMYPTSELAVRDEITARQVRQEHPGASDTDLQPLIAAAQQAARDAVIATDPTRYLSLHRLWHLRDLSNTPSMTLLGADKEHFIFRYGTWGIPVAVLKDELREPDRIHAEQLSQQLDTYFAQHPAATRPSLDTPNRIIRDVNGTLSQPTKVVALDENSITLQPSGGQPYTTFLERYHFIDIAEARRMLGQPESVVRKMDPAQQRLAKLMEMKYWSPRPVGTERPFGLHAQLIGRNGDDYIMRNDIGDFLVAKQDLDEGQPAEADRILAEMADLARTNPDLSQLRPATVPPYRVWVHRLGRFVGPGKPIAVTTAGEFIYLTPGNKRVTATRFELAEETLADIYAQLTLAQQLGPAAIDATLTITPEAKTARLAELRTQYLTDLAELTADSTFPLWKARDMRVAFPGKFLGFDGDDAILEGHGKVRFRIYKFAIAPESLAKMESQADEMSKTAKKPAFQPADVVMRLLRAQRNNLIGPGRPVEVTNNMYISVLPDGRFDQVSVDEIHPQDGGEVRGQLYRQDTGLTKDPDYDAQFQRPVAAEEMLTQAPPLSDELKKRLDQLLAPRQPVWQQSNLALTTKSEVLGINADGSYLLVADDAVQVVRVASGETFSLPVPADSGRVAVFFGHDGTTVWLPDGTAFVEWDFVAGKAKRTLKDITRAPLAGCLSGDGERLFLVMPTNQLLTTRVSAEKTETVDLPAVSGATPKYKVQAATDGLTCAVTWPGHLALERLDPESGNVTPIRDTEFPDSEAIAVLLPKVMMFGPADSSILAVAVYDQGRPVTPQVVLGLRPRSLQIITVDGKPYLQCIGRRGDKYSQKSLDHFAVLLQLPAQRSFGEPQIIPDVAGPELLVSSDGRVAVHRKTGGTWVVARRQPIQLTADKQLDLLAGELIMADNLGQIEAVYAYLRSGPFDQIGDFPDELADLWIDYLYANTMGMGIQHGGDLIARGEAITSRWYKRYSASVLLKSLAVRHQIKRGWAARGSGYANTVTEEGFIEYQRRLQKANKLVATLLNDPEPPASTFTCAIDVATGLATPKQELDELITRMMSTRAARSRFPHQAMALNLLPRWHGEPGECEQYIEQRADEVGGEAGDVLYAQLVGFLSQLHDRRQPLTAQLTVDLDRSMRGLRVYYASRTKPELLEQLLLVYRSEANWELFREAIRVRAERKIYQSQLSPATYQVLLDAEQQALQEK